MNIDDLEKGANHTLSVVKKVQNIFWKEVLSSWSQIKKKHTPQNIDDVCGTTSYLKLVAKKSTIRNGAQQVFVSFRILFMPYNNCFLFLNEIEVKYNLKMNPLEYNGVLHAVKSNFKHIFQANVQTYPIPRPFIPFHLSLNLKDKKCCISRCNYLMNIKVPKAKQNWGQKLGLFFPK